MRGKLKVMIVCALLLCIAVAISGCEEEPIPTGMISITVTTGILTEGNVLVKVNETISNSANMDAGTGMLFEFEVEVGTYNIELYFENSLEDSKTVSVGERETANVVFEI